MGSWPGIGTPADFDSVPSVTGRTSAYPRVADRYLAYQRISKHSEARCIFASRSITQRTLAYPRIPLKRIIKKAWHFTWIFLRDRADTRGVASATRWYAEWCIWRKDTRHYAWGHAVTQRYALVCMEMRWMIGYATIYGVSLRSPKVRSVGHLCRGEKVADLVYSLAGLHMMTLPRMLWCYDHLSLLNSGHRYSVY